MADTDYILELKGICKSFGATRALDGVDLKVRRGEVHALIGENGAGKSTLMKILSGVHQASSGDILLDGQARLIGSPSEGRRLGIGMIYQELNLAPHLSVEENLTLGVERSSWGFVRNQRGRIAEVLALLQHPDLSLEAKAGTLAVGLQQIVEIARSLLCVAKVIIMDEPTSSLAAPDKEALFAVIRRLRDSGVAVIYISHFLEEVREIADSFTVLRDGRVAGSGRMSETSLPEIIRMMVGRSLTEMFPRSERKIGGVVLKIEETSPRNREITMRLELRRGEVLGIFGLVGAGRSELLRRIFGLDRSSGGTLQLENGAALHVESLDPSSALGLGIDFLSEDRKDEGLAQRLPVRFNATLSSVGRYARPRGWGLMRLNRERVSVERWIRELNIRCLGVDQTVSGLSGGNQQKVAFARILERGNGIILLDEPTRGVDVGSKVEIYRLIDSLAAEGKAVVVVSSYLPELLGVCDRLAVMHRGELSPARQVREWTELEIMRFATSGASQCMSA